MCIFPFLALAKSATSALFDAAMQRRQQQNRSESEESDGSQVSSHLSRKSRKLNSIM